MFSGTYTAIVTPFQENGEIDFNLFAKLIELQIVGGVEGVVVCGTTGESPTLTYQENIDLVCRAVDIAQGQLKIIAGTGANATREAIEMTSAVAQCGISASLQVAPYYNKPSQEGFYQHFKTIAEAVPEIPHILYNVPGRTGKNVAVETILRLAKIDNIVAIKEASGNAEQVKEICEKKADDFYVLSGDDALTTEFCCLGAVGLVSVASNIFPQEITEMLRLLNAKKYDEAQKIHNRFADFFDACFIENNPCAIKAMMQMKNLCAETVRLPLVPIRPENKQKMQNVLDTI